ncbi:MAG: hypothetical protein GYB31_07580 [Bacteroidetes bacterium]|nr:hypothetical protein [Bacteroidota bacterium]
MRILSILIFSLLFISPVAGQYYYVAFIKGEVYYQDSLLKKKDRIEIKGELRFKSSKDYVKLSGPNGLFTFSGTRESETENEFILALRKELFPEVRHYAASEYDHTPQPKNYFVNQGKDTICFFDETVFINPIPKLKPGEEIGYLHETPQGLFYQPAFIRDSFLVLREKDFLLKKTNGKHPKITKTAVLKVMDKSEVLTSLSSHNSLDSATINYLIYGLEYPLFEYILNEETNEFEEVIMNYPAEILDEFGLVRFIKKQSFIDDLQFHLDQCKAKDMEEFLEVYQYQDYLDEVYPTIYRLAGSKVLREELKFY